MRFTYRVELVQVIIFNLINEFQTFLPIRITFLLNRREIAVIRVIYHLGSIYFTNYWKATTQNIIGFRVTRKSSPDGAFIWKLFSKHKQNILLLFRRVLWKLLWSSNSFLATTSTHISVLFILVRFGELRRYTVRQYLEI